MCVYIYIYIYIYHFPFSLRRARIKTELTIFAQANYIYSSFPFSLRGTHTYLPYSTPL